MPPRWPRDNQSALIGFYGDPGKGEVARQLVPVVPPFQMYYGKSPVKRLLLHRKCASAFASAFQKIWDYYGRDQAVLDRLRISQTAGTYNKRFVRGSTTRWSNHAFAAALDLDADHNGLRGGHGVMPLPVVAAFKSEGMRWGGDYKGRTDPMHFEACDGGEPQRTFEEWLRIYRQPPSYSAPAGIADLPAEENVPENGVETGSVDGGESPDTPPDPDTVDSGLIDVQRRLSAMHYSAGVPNGKWGGMTAGAIAGFMNDREMTTPAPTSRASFDAIEDDLIAEITSAEHEGFVRPVTEARASADPTTVAEVAPEVVPAKRNFVAAAWAAVVAFFTGIANALKDTVSSVWDFFSDHKSDVPGGFLSNAWDYVASVPIWVWLIAAAAGLAFLAFNAQSSVKKITTSVQTGARQ